MLNSTQRVRVIEKHYRRKTAGPAQVYRAVRRSITSGKAISVIRLGDVMAKLLSGRNVKSLNYVSDFLGIPLPPSKKVRQELMNAVRSSDIVGLSHYESSMQYISLFMKRSGWRPRVMADSFINDQMYERGLLHRLLRSYKVALVGRAAPAAAKELRRQGINVALTVPLDSYAGLGAAYRTLARHRGSYQLVLVGASVPGRILCPRIARRLGRTAIEIGHMMDAFSQPRSWGKHKDSRRVFKFRWMRKIRARRKIHARRKRG
ncbi:MULTISPECIES: GT-D fold domain-containing protein [Paenibacillus]|uniref:GT-D fold domain-containing protein n=1 Tax=Paenibacillus TaxID=44249 RepID=UPI0022B85CCC|nr:GT-D fold domain-containing glycosyltransferase [Paenibacillus caseinilyticus]MCZ8522754.1 GT-D fold domain-containing glycosyltransferase [Paenibacillus caseinilyticus]